MIITDHALLRYLERVVQLDIDALRKDILPYEVQEQASKGGDGVYLFGGYAYVVQDKKLITMYPHITKRRAHRHKRSKKVKKKNRRENKNFIDE